MRVLFMGTSEFARTALESLIRSKFEVIGVVTQPDKPAGRKLVMTPPPVKECAIDHKIPLYQPQTLRGEEFAGVIKEIAPDIIVVAAYGKILPKNIIDEYTCVNIHASLLPKYRGASPITAAIMGGEKVTGITIIYMDEGIDTGDMILKRELEIGNDETFAELHDRLAVMGGELIAEALEQIKSGAACREKQPEDGISYAGKLNNEMCEIDWSLPAKQIHDKIRGLSSVSTAFTWLNGKKLKIYKSRVADDGIIELLEVQIEGGKRMSAGDFANGRKDIGNIGNIKNEECGKPEGSLFRFSR